MAPQKHKARGSIVVVEKDEKKIKADEIEMVENKVGKIQWRLTRMRLTSNQGRLRRIGRSPRRMPQSSGMMRRRLEREQPHKRPASLMEKDGPTLEGFLDFSRAASGKNIRAYLLARFAGGRKKSKSQLIQIAAKETPNHDALIKKLQAEGLPAS